MQTTGVSVLDTTIQKTNIWIEEVMEELGVGDRRYAYVALRSVLHTLRDRLTMQEAADLGSQLPMLIRGFYYDSWQPSVKPVKFNRDEFLTSIRLQLAEREINPEDVIKSIFHVVERHITNGEIEDIKAILPPNLAVLWEE